MPTPSPISAALPAISGHGVSTRRTIGTWTAAASTPASTSHDQVAYGISNVSASMYASTATGTSTPCSTSCRRGRRIDHASTQPETSSAAMPTMPSRAPKPDQSAATRSSTGEVTASATSAPAIHQPAAITSAMSSCSQEIISFERR